MSRVIAPLACHFREIDVVCHTTIIRMQHACAMAHDGDLILLGGDIPFVSGGPTLGSLMRDWFVQQGIAKSSLLLLKGVYGTFSEAQAACTLAKNIGARNMVVISSQWYFFAGASIWEKRAKENGVSLSFVAVPRTGGLRTWLLYLVIGVIVRAADSTRLDRYLELFFTRIQERRKNGFTFNGCG